MPTIGPTSISTATASLTAWTSPPSAPDSASRCRKVINLVGDGERPGQRRSSGRRSDDHGRTDARWPERSLVSARATPAERPVGPIRQRSLVSARASLARCESACSPWRTVRRKVRFSAVQLIVAAPVRHWTPGGCEGRSPSPGKGSPRGVAEVKPRCEMSRRPALIGGGSTSRLTTLLTCIVGDRENTILEKGELFTDALAHYHEIRRRSSEAE